MSKSVIDFWRDESGTAGPEWALITSILVLGSIAAVLAFYTPAEEDARPDWGVEAPAKAGLSE